MAPKISDSPAPYQPNPAVMELWPDISGNTINGLSETGKGRPRPVFWRTDGSTPHAPVMYYFYQRSKENPKIVEARKYRERTSAIETSAIAGSPEVKPAGEWTTLIKAAALQTGADDVGICAYKEDWSFEDRPQPAGKWAIVMAFKQDYENMLEAPAATAYIEVMQQYGRAGDSAKHLANWIQEHGHQAAAKTGPMTEDVLMIPAAIEAGLGELGKHGSMIHKSFGSNFRLSMVLTDVPLEPDQPEIFGADEFCTSCQICTNACPPGAIAPTKQMVRGETKWYVDFDKCIPYFVDYETCGICLVVCPWSRPGVADNLLAKMARRRQSG
ncbi:MAG: 4Fe-4S dicluster domain-containing protein [Rhodospirillales bacterium]|jgi:ferredoxin